jgi:hypothetical protein
MNTILTIIGADGGKSSEVIYTATKIDARPEVEPNSKIIPSTIMLGARINKKSDVSVQSFRIKIM